MFDCTVTITLYISPSLSYAEALENIRNLSFACCPNTTANTNVCSEKYSNKHDQVMRTTEWKNPDHPLLSDK